MLRKWVREQKADPVHAFPGEGQEKPAQAELTRLRREGAKLKMERDILKRPPPTSQWSRCQIRLRGEAPSDLAGRAYKHFTCRALGVTRSGFFAWLTRVWGARSVSDAVMGQEVRTSLLSSDRTCGARCVWRDVARAGPECGLHRIERPMRMRALRARPRRRARPVEGGERNVGALAPNILDRRFTAAAPNEKWAAISPSSGPLKAGNTWPWCWISIHHASSSGPCSRP